MSIETEQRISVDIRNYTLLKRNSICFKPRITLRFAIVNIEKTS